MEDTGSPLQKPATSISRRPRLKTALSTPETLLEPAEPARVGSSLLLTANHASPSLHLLSIMAEEFCIHLLILNLKLLFLLPTHQPTLLILLTAIRLLFRRLTQKKHFANPARQDSTSYKVTIGAKEKLSVIISDAFTERLTCVSIAILNKATLE